MAATSSHGALLVEHLHHHRKFCSRLLKRKQVLFLWVLLRDLTLGLLCVLGRVSALNDSAQSLCQVPGQPVYLVGRFGGEKKGSGSVNIVCSRGDMADL